MKLEGKIAIITGAARGMGESHARLFVSEGAQVVLTDIDAAAGTALASELGDCARFIQHDVADPEAWRGVVDQAVAQFGGIDILINNAGILGPIASLADLAIEDYLRVCAINQHSQFFGMKAVVPVMLERGGGSIVNISSIAGLVANYGAPSVAYVSSKFAVRGLTKAAAMEYGGKNIRVNSVHPGFIRTPMMVEGTNSSGGSALSLIPLARIGEPDEVSKLVLFLASDDASYITGAEHIIDAGMTAH